MSYDIYLTDKNGDTIEINGLHFIRGGTFSITGSNQLHLNITYNYTPFFYAKFGKRGIRALYGMTVAESVPLIEKIIKTMRDDPKPVAYWEATEGNAKIALKNLLALARLAPNDAKWDGD